MASPLPTREAADNLVSYLLERYPQETEDLAQTLGFSLSALNAASAGPVAGVPAKAKLVQQHHREDRRLARVLHLAKSLQPQLPGNP